MNDRSVWEIANRIRDGIEVMRRESPRGPGWRRSALYRDAHATVEHLQEVLATEFGQRQGWRYIPHAPAMSRIARFCGIRAGARWDGWMDEPPRLDHPSFYEVGRRLVAIASEPYGQTAEDDREANEWAAPRGLVFWRPADYPSWWNPGGTVLCVFARGVPAVLP
jgi:hypothetical protein